MRSSTKALDESIQESCRKLEGYLARIDEVDKALARTRESLEAVQKFIRKHNTDEGLIEDLAGILSRFETLREKDDKLKQEREALSKSVEILKDTALAVKDRRITGIEAKKSVDDAGTKLKDLRDQVENLLEGRDLPAWPCVADVLKVRQHRLENAECGLKRIGAEQNKIEELVKNGIGKIPPGTLRYRKGVRYPLGAYSGLDRTHRKTRAGIEGA